MGMPDNGWKRRHAIQIAAQLPDDPADALAVLELAKALVVGFLLSSQPSLAVVDVSAEVVTFSAAATNAR